MAQLRASIKNSKSNDESSVAIFFCFKTSMERFDNRSLKMFTFFANFLRKYGTTSPAIVKGRHKPIKLVRQGGV